MTKNDRKELINTLIRLIDDDIVLTPRERRDMLECVCGKLGSFSVEKYLQNTKNNRKLKVKRGTAPENDEYTGVCGEITMDTDTKTLRIHDGTTAGGTALARASDIPITSDIIHGVMPDYQQATQIGAGVHIAQFDGWLIVDVSEESSESGWRVEFGVLAFNFFQGYTGTDYPHNTNGLLPVARGTEFRLELRGTACAYYVPCIVR